VPEYIYPDDVFIVSYPKSGNTWMRFLIGNYLTGNECSFENCHRITPDIHMNPDRCREIDRPRFIKSHAPFQPQYPKVIYIVRDPRDIAVSYFRYRQKIGKRSRDASIQDFLDDFFDGVGPYGAWDDHIRSWLNADTRLLRVRYEDMLDDAASEFRRVLQFIPVEIDDEALVAAVEASSFSNMRKMEEENAGANIRGDSSTRFVRKGKKGNWRTIFDDATNERFVYEYGNIMSNLGYL
jgi:hypothetical protein